MKKKMSNRDKTFWAVVIPVVVLFFAFNTLPMIKGVINSFTNYKRYGSYAYEDRSVWKSLIVLMDLIDGIKKNSTYSSMLIKQAESNDDYFWGLCHPKRWH